MKRNAFTLVELLTVVAIVAVLAGIAWPIFQRAAQSGKAASCLNNLRQLGTALNLYLGEHDQKMPALMAGRSSITEEVPVIDNTLNVYAPDSGVFACPGDTGKFATTTGTSYYWNSALSEQPVASLNFMNNTTVSAIPILSDKEGFHPYIAGKVNILYGDGHITQGLHFSFAP